MTGRDRRRAARAGAAWPVSIETFDRRAIPGEVVDVSTSGMRVRAQGELAVGAAVTLRVALPHGADRLEVVARVARRVADELALDFIGLPETEARRVKPFVPAWEARRRAPRVHARVPMTIGKGTDGSAAGATVDLSQFSARVATELPLQPGDRVTLQLSPPAPGAPLALTAVVWDGDSAGTVLVFVNLSVAEFARLGVYVSSLIAREG
ncbi:MAG: PilZ domain-containing protein [Candidatus Rokubacteria bacterium]|nr:PilZ domain-containing protein [Candidatus Rokubacteria bacterium]